MRRLSPALLAALCAAVVAPWGQASEGRIAGVVRSATTGATVRSAVVKLRPLSEPKGVTRTATSGPEGEFEFAPVPAGRYEFALTKTGFQTLRGLSTRVSLREDQQLTGLAFQLQPNGAISGVVFDPEGEPLPDAHVRAFAVGYQETGVRLSAAGRAKSDDLGRYRIYGLKAGSYLLRVSPPAGSSPAGEFYAGTTGVFYPGADSPSQALPLKAAWGQELTGVNLRLSGRPGYVVAGTLWNAETGGPCLRCTVGAVQVDGDLLLTLPQRARVSREGIFVLEGLTPGDYLIAARRHGGNDLVSRRPVTITNRHVEDAALVVGQGKPVRGRVVLLDPPDGVDPTAWTPYISATILSQSWPDRESDITEGMEFAFDAVPASAYRFEVLNLPPGAYLKALQVGGQKLPRPVLTLSEDAPLTGIRAEIAFDGAAVSGRVRPPRAAGGEAGPMEARVTMIPKTGRRGYAAARSVETASDGSFYFDSVTPGAYVLYALPLMSSARIFDPAMQAALRPFSKTLDLEAGQSATVELRLGLGPG